MKLHIKAIEADGVHTKFIVFMNGANCGQLTMSEDEAIFFNHRVTMSPYGTIGDEVISSGHWIKLGKED